MRGVWLADGQVSCRDDLEPPRPARDEAVVDVRLAGLCGTDLELLRGYRPFEGVPGHEWVGVVREGPASLRDRRVVGEISATCPPAGDEPPCPACLGGRGAHCERRTVIGLSGRDGAFAERMAVPIRNLHAVPDAVSDRDAVFAEPLAAAWRILEQIGEATGSRALVVGPGRLGTLVARVLEAAGATVDVAARSTEGIEAARARGLNALTADQVRRGAYDTVVDCTGSPSGFGVARAAVRPLGTLVLKSTYTGELAIDASGLVVDEIRIVGSRCGPFPTALESLADGRIRVDDLVDALYPLPEVRKAFRHAGRPGVLKILLEP